MALGTPQALDQSALGGGRGRAGGRRLGAAAGQTPARAPPRAAKVRPLKGRRGPAKAANAAVVWVRFDDRPTGNTRSPWLPGTGQKRLVEALEVIAHE